MISEPKVEERAAQPYAGIRIWAALPELPQVIPQTTREVFVWLRDQGIAPAGPPFIRYHVINMADKMDIELGVPVAAPVAGNGRVQAGVLPAGRYAALLYTGPYEGDGLMRANGALLDWGAQQGLTWDNWPDAHGDAFGSRVEHYITDPAEEPDPAKWETEVAIRLADAP